MTDDPTASNAAPRGATEPARDLASVGPADTAQAQASGVGAATANPAASAPIDVDPSPPDGSRRRQARVLWALLATALLATASLALSWRVEQRSLGLEQELVRRQQDSAAKVAEAQLVARQSQDGLRENQAKLALLEARVAEVAVQRSQLEELIQSLSRSRDENLLVDVEAGLRVALQQTAITGSAEPLVTALRQSDLRLSRYGQPRLQGVRRAIARDLDRVKAITVTDVASLAIRLDEAIRMVDELPLLAVAIPRSDALREPSRPASAAARASVASAASAAWSGPWTKLWSSIAQRVWAEARSLVRVTRIDHPDAMLLAPDQSFFVRENLKLRLLNARLALFSRQFDTAQADLQASLAMIERYFERGGRRTTLAADLIRQVSAEARQVGVPRPDDTFAALTAAAAGR